MTSSAPYQLQAGEFLGERRRALSRRDALELGPKGLHPERLQALDIHARGVEVADLLRRGALRRRTARPCRLLQQVAQLGLDRPRTQPAPEYEFDQRIDW